MAFRTFTLLCDHHPHPAPECVIIPNKLRRHLRLSPHSPPPAPGSHHLTFGLGIWLLGTSCKCTHVVFVFFWLAYITWNSVLKVHPYCRRYQFLSFLRLSNNSPLCAYPTFCFFIPPLMDTWVASMFGLLWVMLLWTGHLSFEWS